MDTGGSTSGADKYAPPYVVTEQSTSTKLHLDSGDHYSLTDNLSER